MPESSTLVLSEKFSSNNFAISDSEDSPLAPLNRGVNLPLLRMLLAIRQKSQESSFWEVLDSFVLIT